MKRTSSGRNTKLRPTRGNALDMYLPSMHIMKELLQQHRQFRKRMKKGRLRLEDRYFLQHLRSANNGQDAAKAKDCACFRCLKHFSVDKIDFWLGDGSVKTATCPYCNIDTVIIETEHDKVDDDMLKYLHNRYCAS